MNIYNFLWSDGYYSCVLLHEKKFSEEELELFYDESTKISSSDYKKWLVQEKGFKEAEYATLNFDCGSIAFFGGDTNG
ncbi:hypothetical protein [Bacillus sp. JJ722]|uniref:hypothetical protein n=1 Tax=Bacillus sp. JJ722 TaxID=3122973 RepID=UPI002FFE24B9